MSISNSYFRVGSSKFLFVMVFCIMITIICGQPEVLSHFTNTNDILMQETSDYFSLVLYPNGVYNVYWSRITDGNITFILNGTGPLWLGIAWNTEFAMVRSEAVVGWVGSKGAEVAAYDLTGEDVSLVNPSTSLSVHDSSVTMDNGVLTVKFTRSIYQGRFPLYSSVLTLGAWGDTNYLDEHPEIPTVANSANIDYNSGTVSAVPAQFGLREAHVLLELLAWNVMIPIGIFFARYGRNLPNNIWFSVHQYVQPSAYVIGVIGFILAFVMTAPGMHFTQVAHSEIGTIIIILALGQVLYGIFRPHKEEGVEQQKTARVWFERIHPILGVFIVVLVVIQTFLGIWQAQYPNYAYYIYLLFLLLVFALILYLEMKRRKRFS